MTDNSHRAQALQRYPVLTNRPSPVNDAIADQIDSGMNLPHALVENYFANGPRSQLAVHIAEDRLGKVRSIADHAKQAYDHEFSSPSGYLGGMVSGYTVEGIGSAGYTPDTRVYAILARYPFERTPITSSIEFNAFAEKVRKQPTCDLQIFGPSCDAFLARFWSDGRSRVSKLNEEHGGVPVAVLIPIVRGDVIVFVFACLDCRAAYYYRHGISAGEIVDPDDVID